MSLRGRSTGREDGQQHARALPAGVRLFESSEELAAAALGDVLIVVWRRPMTVERVRRVNGYNQQLLSERERYAVLVVVEPDNNASPDAATREETARLTASFETTCLGVALVLEGTGIKHTVMRLAITTIQLISTQHVPQPVFDTVASASQWLSERMPALPAGALTAAVDALRAQPAR